MAGAARGSGRPACRSLAVSAGLRGFVVAARWRCSDDVADVTVGHRPAVERRSASCQRRAGGRPRPGFGLFGVRGRSASVTGALARVAELADAQDSGSCVRKDVRVQVPPRAQRRRWRRRRRRRSSARHQAGPKGRPSSSRARVRRPLARTGPRLWSTVGRRRCGPVGSRSLGGWSHGVAPPPASTTLQSVAAARDGCADEPNGNSDGRWGDGAMGRWGDGAMGIVSPDRHHADGWGWGDSPSSPLVFLPSCCDR